MKRDIEGEMMRYVTARTEHICVVCKEPIDENEICIQSQGWGWFYHEDCHRDRFGGSIFHEPVNERPEKVESENIRVF